MGSEEDRKKFVDSVRKACRIGQSLRKLGIRPYGVVRVDSACGVTEWDKDPKGNTKLIIRLSKCGSTNLVGGKIRSGRLVFLNEILPEGFNSIHFLFLK